jgi:hypothetical protein
MRTPAARLPTSNPVIAETLFGAPKSDPRPSRYTRYITPDGIHRVIDRAKTTSLAKLRDLRGFARHCENFDTIGRMEPGGIELPSNRGNPRENRTFPRTAAQNPAHQIIHLCRCPLTSSGWSIRGPASLPRRRSAFWRWSMRRRRQRLRKGAANDRPYRPFSRLARQQAPIRPGPSAWWSGRLHLLGRPSGAAAAGDPGSAVGRARGPSDGLPTPLER